MYGLPQIVTTGSGGSIPLDGFPGYLLAALSLLLGAGMLVVFRYTSNQEAIRATKQRLWAHLFELRLFSDEPLMVWKAHTGLIAANVRYMALMLKPVVILTLPMLLLLPHFDAYFGVAALPTGQTANLTVQLKNALDPAAPAPQLQAPSNVAVETPAVRAIGDRQISWRIRATEPGSGQIKIVLPDGVVDKQIVTGAGAHYIAYHRAGSFLSMLVHPGEMPLSSASVDWVEISHPPASVRWLGFELHWLVWLLLLSMVSALLLKSRMKVSF